MSTLASISRALGTLLSFNTVQETLASGWVSPCSEDVWMEAGSARAILHRYPPCLEPHKVSWEIP